MNYMIPHVSRSSHIPGSINMKPLLDSARSLAPWSCTALCCHRGISAGGGGGRFKINGHEEGTTLMRYKYVVGGLAAIVDGPRGVINFAVDGRTKFSPKSESDSIWS